MDLASILGVVLLFLAAILLFVIILLITKLITTIDKVNIILDDVENKSKKLNGLFDAIGAIGDKLSSANNHVNGFITKIISTVFKQRKKRTKKEEE